MFFLLGLYLYVKVLVLVDIEGYIIKVRGLKNLKYMVREGLVSSEVVVK